MMRNQLITMKRKLSIFLFLISAQTQAQLADDRMLWPEAKINGNPVRLAIDTGSGASLLLSSTSAKRIGLKWIKPPIDTTLGPGEVNTGTTEECDVALGGSTSR